MQIVRANLSGLSGPLTASPGCGCASARPAARPLAGLNALSGTEAGTYGILFLGLLGFGAWVVWGAFKK